MPFTSILYANGPGYVHINGSRENITTVDYCKYRLMPFSFCTHLCCRAPRDAAVRLVPAFCSVKEKEKMVFMVFLSLPSDLFPAQTSLYTCKTLETSHLYFFVEHWTAVLQFLLLLFVPHHCLSHRMPVYIWRWKFFHPPMNCFLKPTILSFWLAWRHLMFLKPLFLTVHIVWVKGDMLLQMSNSVQSLRSRQIWDTRQNENWNTIPVPFNWVYCLTGPIPQALNCWGILPEVFRVYTLQNMGNNGYALQFLKLYDDIFYENHLPISAQMMTSTCSKQPSRWMQRRTAARMWPSTPKAQWLTCFTGWKSRTMWHTSWRTPPAWNPTGTAHTPTRTHPAQSWICQLTSSVSCWDYSFSWDDPRHPEQSLISSHRHFMH